MIDTAHDEPGPLSPQILRFAITGLVALTAGALLSSCSKGGNGVTTPVPPGGLAAGWNLQAPHPGVTTFDGVATPDANTVVAVGKKGLIARKSGSGAWQISTSGTTNDLHDVSFANASAGLAVGANGTVLRTANGGQSWQSLSPAPSVPLYGVQSLTPAIACIVGESGTILRTTDGGSSWADLSSDAGLKWYAVHFIHPDTGWVGGANGDSALLLVTTNGGASWTRQCCLDVGSVSGIAFNGSTGMAVGQSTRLVSRDRGATWLNLALPDVNAKDVAFADANKITVVGFAGTSNQSYSYSSDGGFNWNQPDHPGPRHPTTSVSFADASTGWSTGDAGTVLRTDDGGASWDWGSSIPRETLTGVFFADARLGWVVGQPGIFRTMDAGGTWVRQRPPHQGGAALEAVWFTSPMKGFAVGVGAEPMLRTSDGGLNWTVMNPTSNGVRDIYFLDANRGWFVGTNDIQETTDGGDTWVPVSDGVSTFREYYAVHFVDENTGWVAGYEGRLARTIDGGVTWTPLMAVDGNKRWRDLYFADANEGWMVGSDAGFGVILHTIDGGATWESQHREAYESYQAIRFVGDEGWAVGNLAGVAMILHTTDGGATWTDQALGRYPFGLNAISLVEGRIGTAVGNFGLILRTENGGLPN